MSDNNIDIGSMEYVLFDNMVNYDWKSCKLNAHSSIVYGLLNIKFAGLHNTADTI